LTNHIFPDKPMAESDNVMYSEVKTKGKKCKSKGEILFFLKNNII